MWEGQRLKQDWKHGLGAWSTGSVVDWEHGRLGAW